MDSSLQVDNPLKLQGKVGIWEVYVLCMNNFSTFECLNVEYGYRGLDAGVCRVDGVQLC